MAKVIDYYYVLISPWTYLGGPRFDAIAARHGATVNCKPMDLAKVFPVSGGLPLAKRAPQRQAYRLAELERWRDHLGMEINLMPKFFPANYDLAQRMVVAAVTAGGGQGGGGADPKRLSHAILRAIWADDGDIADAATLAKIADDNGMDGTALLAMAQAPEVLAAYEANTTEAIERGVFGAPSYIFNNELLWGQDRLDFLDRALAAG
ncbi:MAG: 2-hydroxychromene-2-carboxylate isomerase [Alphaproteobacteria bacterium]